jgi:hypothetical protein
MRNLSRLSDDIRHDVHDGERSSQEWEVTCQDLARPRVISRPGLASGQLYVATVRKLHDNFTIQPQ